MLSKLAIPFSLLTLLVIVFTRTSPGDSQAIEAYHERVAEVINAIPLDIDGWVGQQVPLPQSATNLLRPNALVARQYINEDKGVIATLLVVQCRDTRDMTGHFPPRCYPANGWIERPDGPSKFLSLEDKVIRIYGFQRVAGRVEREITVYSLFALPTGELTTSMRTVRKLSADYEYRKYGAAQLQVVIDGEMDMNEHQWILEEMFEIARPAIDAVLDAQLGQQREGDKS